MFKTQQNNRSRNENQIIQTVNQWTESLKSSDSKEQRKFYDWTFSYLKQESNKAVLPLAEAISAWQQIIILKKWKFFEKFTEFLQQKTPAKEAITSDEWKMTFTFFEKLKQTKTTQEIISNYSEDDCFPLLFDDFIGYLKSNENGTK